MNIHLSDSDIVVRVHELDVEVGVDGVKGVVVSKASMVSPTDARSRIQRSAHTNIGDSWYM